MLNFFPPEASTMASHVDTLMLFVFLIAVIFASGIALTIIIFSVRYHYSSAVDRTPPTFNYLIAEVIWTGIPLLIVLTIYIWGAKIFVRLETPPSNAIPMYVVGKQWMWKMQHLEGRREIDELHVPIGYPIKLIMTSQDVIHSFFVPAFRMKQDVLPGRYTTAWFEATRVGEYHLFCAQYCGTSHSGMIGKIIAMTPADYERWLAGDVTPTLAASEPGSPPMEVSGAGLFKNYQCITCHKSDNTGPGPALEGLYGSLVTLADGRTVTADDTYIRESILEPNAKIVQGYKAVMPTFQGQLQEDDVLQLLAYIKSLKKK